MACLGPAPPAPAAGAGAGAGAATVKEAAPAALSPAPFFLRPGLPLALAGAEPAPASGPGVTRCRPVRGREQEVDKEWRGGARVFSQVESNRARQSG